MGTTLVKKEVLSAKLIEKVTKELKKSIEPTLKKLENWRQDSLLSDFIFQ